MQKNKIEMDLYLGFSEIKNVTLKEFYIISSIFHMVIYLKMTKIDQFFFQLKNQR